VKAKIPVRTKNPLASRLETVEGAAEALDRLQRRGAESMAAFILSLARNAGPVGDQVRTFLVGDAIADAVQSIDVRIAQLGLPTGRQRHAQDRQVGIILELILDSIEHLVLPVAPAAAFDLLVRVIEADGAALETCGDDDWEVSCAYERVAHLMAVATKTLPRTTVDDRIRALIANDDYGVRAALEVVLSGEEEGR
jgi:hypothetical protein